MQPSLQRAAMLSVCATVVVGTGVGCENDPSKLKLAFTEQPSEQQPPWQYGRSCFGGCAAVSEMLIKSGSLCFSQNWVGRPRVFWEAYISHPTQDPCFLDCLSEFGAVGLLHQKSPLCLALSPTTFGTMFMYCSRVNCKGACLYTWPLDSTSSKYSDGEML